MACTLASTDVLLPQHGVTNVLHPLQRICNELDRFCSHCGKSHSDSTQHNISTSGDGSFNAGQQNVFTGNTIHMEPRRDPEPHAYIDRVKTSPLTVAGHPIKAAWITFSGALGMVGSIASIWSVWQSTTQYFWIFLMAFSMVTLLVGVSLSRQRFTRISQFLTFESNQAGDVFLTKIEGKCPKCDGVLKLRDIGEKEQRTTIVRCTRNPDHSWLFDPTVLGEPGIDDAQ